MIREKIRKRKVLRRRYSMNCKNKDNNPVLYVFRSNKYIYGSIINNGLVLCHKSSLKTKNNTFKNVKGVEVANIIGKDLRIAAIDKGIDVDKVLFDISFRTFHGRVKAFIKGFTNKV